MISQSLIAAVYSSSSERQRTDNPRFGLAALAEQNHMMAREHAIFDIRQYGVVVADDSGQHLFLAPQPVEQIIAHLDPHRLRTITRALQFAEGM